MSSVLSQPNPKLSILSRNRKEAGETTHPHSQIRISPSSPADEANHLPHKLNTTARTVSMWNLRVWRGDQWD